MFASMPILTERSHRSSSSSSLITCPDRTSIYLSRVPANAPRRDLVRRKRGSICRICSQSMSNAFCSPAPLLTKIFSSPFDEPSTQWQAPKCAKHVESAHGDFSSSPPSAQAMSDEANYIAELQVGQYYSPAVLIMVVKIVLCLRAVMARKPYYATAPCGFF